MFYFTHRNKMIRVKDKKKLLGKSLEEAFELNKVPEFFPQGKVEERTAVP